jgi:hypothetical protein
MNQTICLMCGDPVSLCACRTSPLTPDALERALRARVAELETAALRDEDKLQAADARAFEAEHKLEKAEKMIEALHAARNVMAGDINMGLATERDAALLRLHSAELLLSETIEYLPIGGTEQARAKVERYFRPVVERAAAK